MACPEPEALAVLASGGGGGSPEIADHVATCEACHTALAMFVEAPRVGRYVLERRIGAGGMGVVFEASDPELGRRVAIKMIRGGASAERLRREAQSLARLAHPNVVAVHDVGEHDGQVFIAMALVAGSNLRDWLAQDRRSRRAILDVLVHAGRGVAAAHEAGLVHRDLKPDNIFVSRTGEVLVGDFGLAHDSGTGEVAGDIAATSLTMTGAVLGTPAYMAPEQADGEATQASDQFSFCVTAFEAMYGMRPFTGDTFEELQTNIRAARPRGKLPAWLRRGLAANAVDRFPSMNALIAAMTPRPSWMRRAWPIAVAAVVAGAIVVVATRNHAIECDTTLATWNPVRRVAVAHTLLERHVTPAASDELVGSLDRYATQWIGARKAVCADPPEKVAARRACLGARAAELGDAVHDLETATDPDPLALWQRINALSVPAACRDDATAKLATGDRNHTELMLAIARLDFQSIDRGELDPLRARAEAANDRPALLALELARGNSLLRNHAAHDADAALQSALALAEQLGATSARIDALALLARSACTQGRFDASTPLLVMADADAARDASNGPDADVVMRARAECLYQRGDPAAIPLLRELITRTIARYGADSPDELELHLHLGESYNSVGQRDDGMREFAAFQRILVRFVLPGEQSAEREEDAANTAFLAGDLASALDHQRRAVELHATGTVDHRVSAMSTLALMYEIDTAWQLAEDTNEQILQLATANTEAHAEALVQSGVMRLHLHDLDGAATKFDQASTEAHTAALVALANDADLGRGRVAVERGDFARGARILRDALAVYIKRPDASAYQRGTARFALARALAASGDKPTELAAQAETDIAQGVADAKSNPLGGKLVPVREAMLAGVTRWRDEQSHRASNR